MVTCRYASLYFCMCIDPDDNELEILEIIHHFVEILDRYFGSVSLFISPHGAFFFLTPFALIVILLRMFFFTQSYFFRFASWIWSSTFIRCPCLFTASSMLDWCLCRRLLVFFSFPWPFVSQAYYILDEILLAGELQESSKKTVARLIAAQVLKLAYKLTWTNSNSMFLLN